MRVPELGFSRGEVSSTMIYTHVLNRGSQPLAIPTRSTELYSSTD
jgi:hypothetical protein